MLAERHEFWCSVCDNRVVDSTKPETGKFYTVWGHLRSSAAIKGVWDGYYTPVLFAVCHDCDVKKALYEMKG